MTTLTHNLLWLKRRIFNRHKTADAASGIPCVLGQGISTPYIQPKLTVYWNPPFPVISSDEPTIQKHTLRALLTKLGLRRKSA